MTEPHGDPHGLAGILSRENDGDAFGPDASHLVLHDDSVWLVAAAISIVNHV
jgi:hypothetical protein